MIQAAGYQAILHGHAGGYRSHILPEGKWTMWHGGTRQGAFPLQVNWWQAPTGAYYMAADPWPLAPMILWGILRPKPHLRYRTGSEAAAVPKICRSKMNFCKFHYLNTFDSLAQKCGCVRTLECCG